LRRPGLDTFKAKLKNPVIFDGRNFYDTALVRGLGFEFWDIGR
jgi:UDPglucose 6-dehydrogenase